MSKPRSWRVTKMKYTLDVPIYNRQILCFVGYGWHQLINELSGLVDNEDYVKAVLDNKGAAGLTVGMECNGNVLIWLPHMIDDAYNMAIAEHERRHATDYILSYVGVRHPKNDSSEAHAYLQTWIAEQMNLELAKYLL